jgi:hypothetical protein
MVQRLQQTGTAKEMANRVIPLSLPQTGDAGDAEGSKMACAPLHSVNHTQPLAAIPGQQQRWVVGHRQQVPGSILLTMRTGTASPGRSEMEKE